MDIGVLIYPLPEGLKAMFSILAAQRALRLHGHQPVRQDNRGFKLHNGSGAPRCSTRVGAVLGWLGSRRIRSPAHTVRIQHRPSLEELEDHRARRYPSYAVTLHEDGSLLFESIGRLRLARRGRFAVVRSLACTGCWFCVNRRSRLLLGS